MTDLERAIAESKEREEGATKEPWMIEASIFLELISRLCNKVMSERLDQLLGDLPILRDIPNG